MSSEELYSLDIDPEEEISRWLTELNLTHFNPEISPLDQLANHKFIHELLVAVGLPSGITPTQADFLDLEPEKESIHEVLRRLSLIDGFPACTKADLETNRSMRLRFLATLYDHSMLGSESGRSYASLDSSLDCTPPGSAGRGVSLSRSPVASPSASLGDPFSASDSFASGRRLLALNAVSSDYRDDVDAENRVLTQRCKELSGQQEQLIGAICSLKQVAQGLQQEQDTALRRAYEAEGDIHSLDVEIGALERRLGVTDKRLEKVAEQLDRARADLEKELGRGASTSGGARRLEAHLEENKKLAIEGIEKIRGAMQTIKYMGEDLVRVSRGTQIDSSSERNFAFTVNFIMCLFGIVLAGAMSLR